MSKHQAAAKQPESTPKQNQALAEAPKGGALTVAPPQPAQEIISSDIVIPKLLLMQGLSEFVAEGRARQGEIVRSSTVQKVAGFMGPNEPPKTVDFIPLKITTGWAEKEKIGQKFEFRKAFPRTPQNDTLPWSFWRNAQGHDFDKPGQMGATEWQRVKSIDVYALLPADVDAFEAEMKLAVEKGEIPDLSKTILPVVISFRSTSFNAGKSVTTFFAQVAEMAQTVPTIRSYNYKLSLGCKADKNDKGSFFVFDVGQPKPLDPKYRAQAEKWMNTLNTVKDIKVDDSGETERVQEGGSY